jgi:hypothetical protein
VNGHELLGYVNDYETWKQKNGKADNPSMQTKVKQKNILFALPY